MRLLTLLITFLMSTCCSAIAQSCISRASKTIQTAVLKAGSGDMSATRALIDEAEQSCSNSAVIKRQLADVYRNILLDTAKSDALIREAQSLDGKHFTAIQPTGTRSVIRDKWALVMGVSKFENLPAQSQLDCPSRDARDFAQALQDPSIGRFRSDGLHVRLLTDEEATLQHLMKEIDYISTRAKEDDLVVLYISSHRTSSISDRNATGDAQTGYIVTYDTDPKALFSTAFAMEDLKKVLDHLRAKRIVVFLDTCFSGDTVRWVAGPKGSKGLGILQDDAYERVVQGTGRVLIVSSTGAQPSWEGDKNSYFTECLISAMKRNNGMSTVTQIFNILDHDLPYLVLKEKRAEQTPLMWPQGQNVDIVIGSPIQ